MLKTYTCRLKLKFINPKLCRSEASIANRTNRAGSVYSATYNDMHDTYESSYISTKLAILSSVRQRSRYHIHEPNDVNRFWLNVR